MAITEALIVALKILLPVVILFGAVIGSLELSIRISNYRRRKRTEAALKFSQNQSK